MLTAHFIASDPLNLSPLRVKKSKQEETSETCGIAKAVKQG
jgi:hypothetical protein